MGEDSEWSEEREEARYRWKPAGSERPGWLDCGADCNAVVVRVEGLRVDNNDPFAHDPFAIVPTAMRECYCDCPNSDGNFREYLYALGWVPEHWHQEKARGEKERQKVAKLSKEEREKDRLEKEKAFKELEKEMERMRKENPDDPRYIWPF